MNRISIVQAVLKQLRAKSYLEIGVSKGHAFLSFDAKQKIAVDPVNLLRVHPLELSKDNLFLELKKIYRTLRQWTGLEKAEFFEMTSDAFFNQQTRLLSERKIDVAFIDGLHSYGQALRDVENSLQFLNPNGVIVLHDCNPATAAMETPANSFAEAAAKKVPGWDNLWCGDVWKVIVNLRSLHKDLDVFVLDCDMGIGIVTRRKPESTLTFTREQIDRLTYEDLNRDRTRLINLKPTTFFDTFIKSLKISQS